MCSTNGTYDTYRISQTQCCTVPANLESQLAHYTRGGLRVLALATRSLGPPEFDSFEAALNARRARLEQRLTFLGLVVLENRLKPDCAAVIAELRDANIRTLMVTGLLQHSSQQKSFSIYKDS